MAQSPVVLVTGGTAGLGAAVARHFATHGFRVVVNYNSNGDRANKLLEELSRLESGLNARHVAIQADLAVLGDINRLVHEAASTMGRLDVVFSNGGWTRFRDITSLDDNVFEDDWDRAFNMNVKSHLWLLHAAREHLDITLGSFITTASIAGLSQSGSSLVFSENQDYASPLMTSPRHIRSPRLLRYRW
jgi:NAD(P)-dependent dehydrogenase (short-subunit alcohol dehydrogenase family)